MTQFTVNANRHDPYKQFKFRVKWDGRIVAGISKVSTLRRTTEVIKHREGGDQSSARLSPGLTSYEPVTLERGVTHDAEFEAWANQVWTRNANPGHEVSLKTFRKDIVLELLNEAGQVVLGYHALPLLALGIFGAARPRRQRQRRGDPDAGAAERRLGARHQRCRAERARVFRGVKGATSRPALRDSAPLCPAGHLPRKGGDRPAALISPIVNDAGMARRMMTANLPT